MWTTSRSTEIRRAGPRRRFRRSAPELRRAVVAAIALLALLLPSCAGRDAEKVDRRMMVIGMDGLEWDLMAPMVEDGRLPNFARIIDEGAWGEIRSLDLPVLESPTIWTSITTGKGPEKHGIWGFLKPGGRADPGTPMTSNTRKVKALWNILGDAGHDVGVIDWLVTWPAEQVRGYIVTSYFAFPTRPGWLDETHGLVYPDSLLDEIGGLRYAEGELDDATALEYIHGGRPADGSRAGVLFEVVRACLQLDGTTFQTAKYLYRERPTDFFAVYFRGVDGPSHKFWAAMFPGSGPEVTEEEISTFRDVIPRYYEYMDRVLGELLEMAGDNTTVIVVSDHGHSGPKLRGDRYALGTAMHDRTGVMGLWGEDIASGSELDDACVLDVAPTILALYGMAVADDMDGRVLSEAIEPEFFETHPIRRTDTYETGGGAGDRPSEEPIESPMDEAVRDRLRSLGYIE